MKNLLYVRGGSAENAGCYRFEIRQDSWSRIRNVVVQWSEHLTSDPKVCGGQICARGTRVPVSVILDSLAERVAVTDLLASYPSLRNEHVEAALAYAAELAREESLLPIHAK